MTETDTKKKKKNKKVTISEDDMSLILRRYSATTIIALLQEVSQFLDVSQCPDAKINWNELVKKTSTGITSPREYQMLWRNLAYRDDIEDNLADRVEPLDDDSDLESELEAFPAVSAEASVEAAACAKVLLASGSQNILGPANHATVEAPLTINIPNGQSSRAPSVDTQSAYAQGTNITVPVSVQKQKQSLPSVASTEALEGNGAAGFPPRRKRKPWTEEEDIELIAAVQKCGERNWANILKGDFKGDRTASQLSQRWAIIRKRQANKNSGGIGNKTNSQLTEQQLANRAVSHALNMPVMDSLLAACSAGSAQKGIPLSSAVNEASLVPNNLSQTLHQKGIASTASKSRGTSKKGASGSDSMVQAAAVAAGARIVTPSTAASLLKVSQSKNAFHMRPAVQKSPMPSGTKPLAATNPLGTTVPAAINPSGSRTSVHYMRTGQAPSSTDLSPSGSKQDHGNPMEPPPVMIESVPATIDTKPNLAALQMISAPGTEEVKKADSIFTEDIKPDVTESVGKDSGVVSNSDVLGDAQMCDKREIPRGPESMEVDEKKQPALVKVKTES